MPRVSSYSMSKKDISQFPFHLIEEAFDSGVAVLKEHHVVRYNKYIEHLEQEWTDSHEAPYEGNFTDSHPYRGPDPKDTFEAGFKAVEPVLKELSMQYHSSWLLPQISAWLNKHVLLVKGEDGLYDAKKSFSNVPRGIKIIATFPQRGMIVKTQSSPEGLPHCALVPLLLEPFKKFRKIGYNEWNRQSLKYFVHQGLYEAITMPGDIVSASRVSVERALELRDLGLTDKTNNKRKNPSTTHKLYHLGGTEWENVPPLATVMLAQIWCAMPDARLSTMILDPENLDLMPKAIVEAKNIFKAPNTVEVDDMPW